MKCCSFLSDFVQIVDKNSWVQFLRTFYFICDVHVVPLGLVVSTALRMSNVIPMSQEGKLSLAFTSNAACVDTKKIGLRCSIDTCLFTLVAGPVTRVNTLRSLLSSTTSWVPVWCCEIESDRTNTPPFLRFGLFCKLTSISALLDARPMLSMAMSQPCYHRHGLLGKSFLRGLNECLAVALARSNYYTEYLDEYKCRPTLTSNPFYDVEPDNDSGRSRSRNHARKEGSMVDTAPRDDQGSSYYSMNTGLLTIYS